MKDRMGKVMGIGGTGRGITLREPFIYLFFQINIFERATERDPVSSGLLPKWPLTGP